MKLREFLTAAAAPPLEVAELECRTTTDTTAVQPSNPRNLQIYLEEWSDLKTSIRQLFEPYLDKDVGTPLIPSNIVSSFT